MIRPMIVAALVMGVAACASEPPRRDFRHRGGPPPGGETRMRRGLFISPAGEPFRGEGGLARWFAGADTDHDGSISPAEFQADAERFFRQLDTNHDGVVDGFEISAYEQTVAPEIAVMDFDREPQAGAGEGQRRSGGGGMGGGRHGRGGGGMGGGSGGHGGGEGGPSGGRGGAGREGAARYSLINEPEPVANADENVDGRVTLEEWRHATLRRFKVLDKAGTGRLTLDQLQGKTPPPPKP